MGACASCLGGGRRRSVEEDDEARLLFDEANNMQYGSFGDQQPMTGTHDPLEAQREIEALQRVVARTSDNMVDIFEIAPSKDNTQQPQQQQQRYAPVGHEARQMRYRSLLSRLSAEDVAAAAVPGTSSRQIDWRDNDDEDDEEDLQHAVPQIRTEPSHDALVGNFREAAAAMA